MRVNHAARAAAAEARRARTRERLLDAAERVIAEKGVEASVISDIVGVAGVSRGVFYNYFPSFTDLVHALNQRVAAQVNGLLEGIVRGSADPPTRLAACLHAVLFACTTDPVRGWVAMQLAGSRAPRVRVFEDTFSGLYSEGVAAGVFREADMTAAFTLVFGTLRMAMRDAVAGAPPAPTVQAVALVLAAFGVPYDRAERISRDEAMAARGA